MGDKAVEEDTRWEEFLEVLPPYLRYLIEISTGDIDGERSAL